MWAFPSHKPIERFDWLDYLNEPVEFCFKVSHCRIVLGELLAVPDLIINPNTPISGHRSLELYTAIMGLEG
jgi:hypothetical protein